MIVDVAAGGVRLGVDVCIAAANKRIGDFALPCNDKIAVCVHCHSGIELIVIRNLFEGIVGICRIGFFQRVDAEFRTGFLNRYNFQNRVFRQTVCSIVCQSGQKRMVDV